MKRKIKISRLTLVVLTFWLVLFVSGCSQGVSMEEYDMLSSQLNEAQSKVIELQNENLVQEQQIKQAHDEIFALRQRIVDLNEDNKWLRNEITNLTSKLTSPTPPTPTPAPIPTPAPAPTRPPYNADFIAEPTTGEGATVVQFIDQSTGEIISWAWDFNSDGVIDSTEQNPICTYTVDGLYSVTLTIAGPYGGDRLTRTNYIKITGCST